MTQTPKEQEKWREEAERLYPRLPPLTVATVTQGRAAERERAAYFAGRAATALDEKKIAGAMEKAIRDFQGVVCFNDAAFDKAIREYIVNGIMPGEKFSEDVINFNSLNSK